jgi:hypothetical protein
LAASWRDVRAVVAAVCLLVAVAAPAAAQQARPSRFAIDTAAAIDEAVDGNGNFTTGVIVDGLFSADLGGGVQAIVRPFVQRLPARVGADAEWNRQVWVAELRYERPGPIGIRLEGGLIPSPIGLANLTLRPHLNPTIAQPASLFTRLPPIAGLRGPGSTLIGAVYPYGGQVTLSASHWDARAAVIDTAPMRVRRIFAQANPPKFTNLVVGAGVTPFVGFRVGTSVSHGGWLRAGESPAVAGDHDATIVTIESELSFFYTKLSGEWVRDAVGTDAGDRVATGWFVQGQQTLTPRWFLAGRVERMSAPAVLPIGVVDQDLTGTEETLGYRLTPELTLRVEHRMRRPFGRLDGYDHQGAVSVVWWKRWL